MGFRVRTPATVVIAAAGLLSLPTASLAQVRVIISAGFFSVYDELLPEFERTSGVTVTTSRGGSVGSSPRAIPNQIRRGVPADVVILAREGLKEIMDEGRIIQGTDIDLARSIIGVAVRAGARKPDISTVEALRETLLGAESVSVSTSTSGRYLTTELFPRLGIAEQMAPKIRTGGAAGVVDGEAELGLQQVSEILALEGADLVGPIPEEVQYVTTYSAAVVAGSAHADAARRLIAHLSSEAAFPAIVKAGLEPPRPR